MNPRVPVLNPDGSPAMPTLASRARRWVRDGLAIGKWNDLGVYYVQLLVAPSDTKTQPIALGCDPGKSYSGFGVQSAQATLFRGHAVLPFQRVKERLGSAVIKNGKVIQNVRGRALQRRVRRGRRINRKLPFELRNHRQKRFNNRIKSKLPPSILASRLMEIRIVKELCSIFPISDIVYEVVKADVDLTSGRKSAKSGKGFSPVMSGQYWAIGELEKLAPVKKMYGWQKNGNGTSQIRKYLGLFKDKQNKKNPVPETHAVDGVALAASEFIEFKPFHTKNSQGHEWKGKVTITDSIFRVITRPQYYRRALHFDNPKKGGSRKRKGGTITPFGCLGARSLGDEASPGSHRFRAGDYVEAIKAGVIYRGWIGGYTNSKTKAVSIYDINWKRIGQFSPNKTKLLRRSNKLCVA
ncbi:MAG: RRXRR domain-containing protein [Xenococcaceae cyanobacterium MO_234.B1]|nr:RRXRR domain-containing protein [Xenococcaceae cyanobacterium MO_234.B1]